MADAADFNTIIVNVMKEAGGYSPDCYPFIRDGLSHTVGMVHGPDAVKAEMSPTDDEGRHVDGRELCLGLRDYALRRYGLMSKSVLHRWGIRRTDDFGRIIFAMVEAGLMRTTEEDRIEDFENVYDFDEEFAEPEHFDEPPRAGAPDPVAI